MKKVPGILALGIVLLFFLPSPAQQSKLRLPRVLNLSLPFYPPLAHQARIQGVANFRVSTDGKHVTSFDAENGPPLLVRAAEENVKTWQFQPHVPVSFEIQFEYKLSPPPPCETEFDIGDPKNESISMQLPIRVELSAIMPRICDPSVMIENKK